MSSSSSSSSSVAEVDLAQHYQRKTDKEHVLDNPDTYIGSVERIMASMYVFDAATQRIVLRDIEYIPGLYKLFDEGVVNCRDHVIRMAQSTASNKRLVSQVDVTISAEDGTITLWNDGNGIDVAKHPEYDVWIPEMIFGQLRTSTNYGKDEERIVGGKNGFGFKLVLIWSTYGYIETVDHTRGLKYCQEFTRNLDVIGAPTITKVKGAEAKPYTKVVFRPDYTRFGISEGTLSADMVALLTKRVFDIAAVTEKKIKVHLNGDLVPVKSFAQYVDFYIGAKESGDEGSRRVYETSGDDGRWEYAVALSSTHEFQQMSFVNGICTFQGGKHVEYVLGQLCRKLVDYIYKKKKVSVNATTIKEQLMLFLRCDIVNPSFDSQTKDYLNTPSNKFGSTCSVSDAFVEKVAKLGVMDLACSLTEAKEKRMAARRTDGAKTRTVRGIPNFMDANWSGGPQSKECVLILCEGLSAMSGIVSGLSSEDRNVMGIYPLRGKLLNVRGETTKKVADNKEITDIKKILGLEAGRVYASMDDVHQSLRYGKVLLMTDQDYDGSHIKGLCLNLFHSEWASLTQLPGFLSFMNTPILRATKGAHHKVVFYNEGEFRAWKEATPDHASWKIKYFKGLGTSTSVEFKEYFAHKKIVDFVHSGELSDTSLDKVFNKKRTDDRKTWLEHYDKDAFLDTSYPTVAYEQFIDRELIHFSTYDCARSIPSLVDGLKTSLRKILYCAFKRNLTSEIKVAQLSAYVSENSAYHHGEASLNGAIVAMAQTFVGANNVPLLKPNGQFGTRLQGGEDSASERYIFTELNPLTRYLFRAADDGILHYVDDDGTLVEPEYYVPILPFVLVNGISGIGTGFSTSIAPYHPLDLVGYLRRRIRGEDTPTDTHTQTDAAVSAFVPYFEGFRGTVERVDAHKFVVRGLYEQIGPDKVRITELPVGTWTMSYVAFLEGLEEPTVDAKTNKRTPAVIREFVSMSTELAVDITVTFPRDTLADLVARGELERTLKLSTTVTTTNMHLFDARLQLRKYHRVEDIVDEFFDVRMDAYRRRKEKLADDLQRKVVRLTNKARYIQETLDGVVDLRRKPNNVVERLLDERQFARLDADASFNYLVKMPMDSVSEDNVRLLMADKAAREDEYATLLATTCETMWLRELDEFEREYTKYRNQRIADTTPSSSSSSSSSGSTKPAKKRSAATATASSPTRKKTNAPTIVID